MPLFELCDYRCFRRSSTTKMCVSTRSFLFLVGTMTLHSKSQIKHCVFGDFSHFHFFVDLDSSYLITLLLAGALYVCWDLVLYSSLFVCSQFISPPNLSPRAPRRPWWWLKAVQAAPPGPRGQPRAPHYMNVIKIWPCALYIYICMYICIWK